MLPLRVVGGSLGRSTEDGAATRLTILMYPRSFIAIVYSLFNINRTPPAGFARRGHPVPADQATRLDDGDLLHPNCGSSTVDGSLRLG